MKFNIMPTLHCIQEGYYNEIQYSFGFDSFNLDYTAIEPAGCPLLFTYLFARDGK
jgi:hypothetical protein